MDTPRAKQQLKLILSLAKRLKENGVDVTVIAKHKGCAVVVGNDKLLSHLPSNPSCQDEVLN